MPAGPVLLQRPQGVLGSSSKYVRAKKAARIVRSMRAALLVRFMVGVRLLLGTQL